jgi:hypothetical protein
MPKYAPLNLVFGDTFSSARAATFETQYKLAKERTLPLGGIPDVGVTSATYIDVPGAIIVRLVEDTTVKIHAMGFVSAGTGSLRLWDIGGAAEVAGSEDAFTDTDATLQVGAELELTAGDYKLQVKINAAPNNVVVYGAALVTQ